MTIKNNRFYERIATKFVNSSNYDRVFLNRTKKIIKLSIMILTFIFFTKYIGGIFTSGMIPSVATLIVYSIAIVILLKLTPIYAKFVHKKKIESSIKKYISIHNNRVVMLTTKFNLFTLVSTDSKLFSDIKFASRVSQIENVIFELHNSSFTKRGIFLVINIIDLKDTEQELYLERIITYIEKKGISFDLKL